MSVSFNNLPFLLALKSWRVNRMFISYFLRMKHSSLSSPIDCGFFCFLSRSTGMRNQYFKVGDVS